MPAVASSHIGSDSDAHPDTQPFRITSRRSGTCSSLSTAVEQASAALHNC